MDSSLEQTGQVEMTSRAMNCILVVGNGPDVHPEYDPGVIPSGYRHNARVGFELSMLGCYFDAGDRNSRETAFHEPPERWRPGICSPVTPPNRRFARCT